MSRTALHRTMSIVAAVLALTSQAHAGDVEVCVAAAENGQRAHAAHKLIDARKQFLECARDACPALLRTDCSKWLLEIDETAPTVVVLARDGSGHDLTDVRVTVDGAVVTQKIDGSPITLDPGAHVFRFERLDAVAAPVNERVVLGVGEKHRLLSVQLAPVATSPVSFARPVPTISLIFAGVSVVAAGSFAAFGIKTNLDVSHDHSTCGGHCGADEQSKINTEATIADVSLGVSAVSLALAAYFYFTRPRVEVASRPSVGVARVKGGAVLGMGFAF